MDLYPAVDIRGGRVTHVRSGNAAAASVYGEDPATAVALLAAQGARWVHLVDLDRAYGTGSNRELVRALIAGRPATLAMQVGGSLGSEAAVKEMIEWGADRVVIGCSAAADEPALVGRLVGRYGAERISVGIDGTDGRVTPRGNASAAPWPIPQSVASMPIRFLARLVREQGARTIVYTDVTRDGTLSGPDSTGAQGLAMQGLEVVVSGGIASIADLQAVRDAKLAGAIVGRALHEGHFSLAEALACAG